MSAEFRRFRCLPASGRLSGLMAVASCRIRKLAENTSVFPFADSPFSIGTHTGQAEKCRCRRKDYFFCLTHKYIPPFFVFSYNYTVFFRFGKRIFLKFSIPRSPVSAGFPLLSDPESPGCLPVSAHTRKPPRFRSVHRSGSPPGSVPAGSFPFPGTR